MQVLHELRGVVHTTLLVSRTDDCFDGSRFSTRRADQVAGIEVDKRRESK